jgi:hypothetical protein
LIADLKDRSLSGFTLALPASQITVLETDGGHRVEQMLPSSAVGILYPGERMDMLVEWPQVEAESNLAVILDTEYILPLFNRM